MSGESISDSPMMVDGSFVINNATFDFVSLDIAPSAVSVPSEGSSMASFVGVACRRKTKG